MNTSEQPTKQISIWAEGYRATGENGTAHCIGTYDAIDFDDAVNRYLLENPDMVRYHRRNGNTHSIWVCRLFDNEKQARESFG